jgi:hypothetical protein
MLPVSDVGEGPRVDGAAAPVSEVIVEAGEGTEASDLLPEAEDIGASGDVPEEQ